MQGISREVTAAMKGKNTRRGIIQKHEPGRNEKSGAKDAVCRPEKNKEQRKENKFESSPDDQNGRRSKRNRKRNVKNHYLQTTKRGGDKRHRKQKRGKGRIRRINGAHSGDHMADALTCQRTGQKAYARQRRRENLRDRKQKQRRERNI